LALLCGLRIFAVKTFSHDRIPFVPPRFSRRFPTPLPTSSYVDAIVGVRNTAAERVQQIAILQLLSWQALATK
jgi:hypothetical protein